MKKVTFDLCRVSNSLLQSNISLKKKIKTIFLTEIYSFFKVNLLFVLPIAGGSISNGPEIRVIRCQFHQRFMCTFFVRNTFLCLEFGFEQTFVQKMCAYDVDEIDGR